MSPQPQRTREQAREAFNCAGLTYATLTPASVRKLRALINEQMIASGCMKGTFRCRQRGTLKQTPHGQYAEIRCKADYFSDREAVSFNTDGFIGFAGWSDEKNVQPILAGFEAWILDLTSNQSSRELS